MTGSSFGFLCLDHQADHLATRRHVFQGVHMMLNFGSSKDGNIRPWRPDEKRVCKAVFIGKNLNREELESGMRGCLSNN